MNEALEKPKARNKAEYIERRIGRIEKTNARVAQHYRIDVHRDESQTRVERLSWRCEPVDGTMATHPGVYCFRSNIVDWDVETMWRTYMTLSEVEAVFRSLKSELGLRPVYHQKQHRANGHLLITVLAYQAVCVLRTRMKANGCHDSWTTVRDALCTITRTTSSFERKDGRMLHVRITASADADQAATYKAMGIAPPPRKLHTTIV
ncbi:MAG: transposase [Acidiferrobacterales bacterium]|nr:transposase [Acidiferrobacterales bacterium]